MAPNKAQVKLTNVSKRIVIANDLKVAKSPADKFLGLLKNSNPRFLLFKTRFGIHTLFLKNPIDIIVLNNQNIVKKTATLNPNKFFFYNPFYSRVLELPSGTIKKSKIEIEDKLTINSD